MKKNNRYHHCKAKSTTKKSKYAFSPQRERQEVHDKLTSERHKGKDPDTYVHSQIRSGALLCKSLPGVLTRAYDYQFGIEGPSIMHCSFMDRKKRMEWIDSGSANFSNFSATADFEPAPAATSINDVVGAVRVFQVFAREYCVTSAIELVDAIIGFIEAKIMALRWEPEDIPAFVYWVNDVLESYQNAVASSDKDPGAIRLRCTLDDPLLLEILQEVQERRIQQLEQMSSTSRAPFGTVEATQAIPGRSRRLCMRFLSNAGCDADLHEGAHDGRAHFVPKTLDALVKVEIEKRFDGLKLQYKHL
ncbi:hypothetical protein PHYSODRAFT_511793 [Phytophthora sojae]|uniref:Uncharacterized protein n=1 Tax=Phytophthora sojae (strain P6497) TaxID=1094619 RepID=G4ZRR3_PHYSP|nr:hypothetical protein PHYSODRAFT_511793 [Phytophthora sojae]EGZ13872.1 hypothetical protein PHYSODRAFT_511793 [Phytophthora sojae]|eukprot:XP_009531301.1 hypothetical protein PHYSODRAFT_511793 [Phytophthora sojae]